MRWIIVDNVHVVEPVICRKKRLPKKSKENTGGVRLDKALTLATATHISNII